MRHLIYALFLFFMLPLFVHSHELLTVVQQLSKANPYQAFQVLNAIPAAQLSAADRQEYDNLRQALLFFRLPIHKLGLSDNNISAMALDGQDIWLGDWLGAVVRYNLDTTEVFAARKGRPALTLRSVNHISVEKEEVWIITSDAIITYNKKNGTVVTTSSPSPQGQPMTLLRYQKKLLLVVKNAGIYEWTGENFVQSPLHHTDLVSCQVLINQGETLWAGTTDGLYQYNGTDWQALPAMKGKNITAVAVQDQNLWIATHANGLFLYQQDHTELQQFNFEYPSITSVLPVEKRVFVGMYKGGLAEIREGVVDQTQLNQLSPALLRIGSLAYHDPYLIIGTLGDAVFFIHKSLF